jgi:hypothetical protein
MRFLEAGLVAALVLSPVALTSANAFACNSKECTAECKTKKGEKCECKDCKHSKHKCDGTCSHHEGHGDHAEGAAKEEKKQ